MPLLRSRQQIAIKPEAVAGTAEALALADVVLHTGAAEFEADITMTERAAITAIPSSRGSVPGSRMAKIRWSQFLRGTTAAPADPANLPDFYNPFKGCGVLGVVSGVNPNEQTLFTPNTALWVDATSGCYCTVALYQDGKIYKIHGAVGNCVLTFTVGQPVLAEFEFTGIYNAPSDGALLVPVYPTVIEPAFLDASLSIIGYATAKITSLKFDFGNVINMRAYPNTTTGYFTAQITDRKPGGSFDVEEELAATKNWWAEWVAGTMGAITTGTFPSGGTNYNQLSLSIAKAQYTKVGLADKEGIAGAPIDFIALGTLATVDDDWTLLQT